MAITDPNDTLAYHQSRVLCQHRDMSSVDLATVVEAMKSFKAADQEPSTSPDSEAVEFYTMNHLLAMIGENRAPLEPLAKFELDLVEHYHTRMNAKAMRAFYYLLVICTREARHNKSLKSSLPVMVHDFGSVTAHWFANIKGSEHDIHEMLKINPPATTIGNFVDCIRWQFYNSSWTPGYGGKAWGAVTDCLCRFVHGEFTAEMMLDTIWTLCHNNGPIFNKGHFYSHYSGDLVRILDIQRSGQMPEAVLSDKIAKFAPSWLSTMVINANAHFGGKIGSYVDWYVVEALGSVHKYPSDKSLQIEKHGQSPAAAKALEAKKAKDAAAALKAKQEAEALAKKFFSPMPGVQLKKIHRPVAA